VITLTASLLFTLYLLIPSTIFRFAFGVCVPLRNFVRTRGEEILSGAISTVFPLLVVGILVNVAPPFNQVPWSFADTVEARSADYKLVAGALYSEDLFKQDRQAFWNALFRTSRRQGRFLVWYYVSIGCEGLLLGLLSLLYPWLINVPGYKWVAKNILLPNISEWHLLLTPFYFTDKSTVVLADVLCSDNVLYKGQVWDHSLGKEGQLAGIILFDAHRYARDEYRKDKEKGEVNKTDYWHKIPGTKLYLLGDKILNINLSYEGPTPAPDVMERVISRQLKQPIALEMTQSKKTP
jgi:hypothetical protein